MMTEDYRKEFEIKSAQRFGLPYVGYTRSDTDALKLLRSVLDHNENISYEIGWDADKKLYFCRIYRKSSTFIYNNTSSSLAMAICIGIDRAVKMGLI